jgi:hypothetical protein
MAAETIVLVTSTGIAGGRFLLCLRFPKIASCGYGCSCFKKPACCRKAAGKE